VAQLSNIASVLVQCATQPGLSAVFKQLCRQGLGPEM
jgi:hypothetical protein